MAVATVASFGQTAATPAPKTDQAAPGSGEIVTLPAFGVNASAANQYQADEEMSASRTAGKILDTSMTVNVITPAFMQDIGPATIYDVTKYFAGVSPGRGSGSSGINDRMVFRGFESFTKTLDNFSGFLFPSSAADGGNIDPVFVEHAELLMGPDSILAPTGTPGGSVNLVTKSPQFNRSTDISAMLGKYDAGKFTVDTTGPLGDGKHMAYRLIAMYQDSDTFPQGGNLIYAGSAMLTYKFSDKAQLTFKYIGQQETYKGTATLCNLDGEQVYTADTVRGMTLSATPQPGFTYDGWNGDAPWSYRTMRDNYFQAELTSALTDRINVRLGAQLYYNSTTNWMAYPTGGEANSWDPVTGVEIGVTPINPAALNEVGTWEASVNRQIQLQNDYAGNFEFNGMTVQPVIGWSYQQGAFFTNLYLQDKSMPTANLAAGVYNPPQPSMSQMTALTGDTPSNGWMYQAYAFTRLGLFKDRMFVTAGVERTWTNVNIYNVHAYNLPGYGPIGTGAPTGHVTQAATGNLLQPSVKPSHDAYMAGLLYKITPEVSGYVSFTTNAQVAYSVPLWEAGKQYEFGLKSSLFNNRLSVSVDHFQISESNVQSGNPLYNTGQSLIPYLYADLTNKGYEASITGGITDNLSAVISGTTMHLRDFAGRRQRNIPDNMATFLLNYRFTDKLLKGANVFAAYIHQGSVAGETVTGFTSLGVAELPGFYVAAYNIINAGAGYKIDRYQFNLNVDNVANTKAWWQASSRTSLFPYPPITFRFTMTVHL